MESRKHFENVDFREPDNLAMLGTCMEKEEVVNLKFSQCIFSGIAFVEALTKSTTVKQLDLSNNPLTLEQAVAILVYARRLTHLNLANAVDFYDRYIEHKKLDNQTVDPHAGLLALEKQHPYKKDAINTMFARSEETGIIEHDYNVLFTMASNLLQSSKSLVSLDLSSNISKFSRHQLAALAMRKLAIGMASNENLKELILMQNDINHHCLTILTDALASNKNSTLEKLDLSHNEFNDYDHPTGTLPQYLAMANCPLKTVILDQEEPFYLDEIIHAIASNPSSQLTFLSARSNLREGRIYPAMLEENSRAVAALGEKNTRLDICSSQLDQTVVAKVLRRSI